MRSNSYRGRNKHNHRQWLKLASTRDEVVWDQQPRVSLETWGNSDAWQTTARNILIKRQIFGYRIQQWTKGSCAISVEKVAFYSKPACTNTAQVHHLHAIMKSLWYHAPVASPPHPPHELRPDPLRLNTMSNMRLLKTMSVTKIKISWKYKCCVCFNHVPGLLMVFEAITTFALHTDSSDW